MNKRGQFFLVAALITVAILIGLATVYTSVSSPPRETQVFDLAEQIGYEGNRVIDYGVVSGEELKDLLEVGIDNEKAFTKIYRDYLSDGTLFFFYGDKTEMHYIVYRGITAGTVGFDFGSGSPTIITIPGNDEISGEQPVDEENNKVTATLGDRSYDFTLRPGQNFFFVIQKDKNQERFTITSENE